ncbi:MAG: ATP-binding protein [Actinomycetota bacterium]|nr:ATP-binding protein [Actinomycetota bacterium]
MTERRANILLVDDRPDNLLALEAALEPLNQNLVKASSGEEALRMLLKQEVAVILLDVQMPGLDGFDTAAEIKKREKTKDIPIIFLTAISREPHHALRGYSTGAVDYLAKPFDPWVLRAKVAVFVDLYEKNALLKQQAVLLAQRLEERERAERALEEKAQELERSNADLAQFAYVASHDLQEPLRVMDGYLSLLKDSYGDGSAEEAVGLIERIEKSTARMDRLIQDLLAYARVGTETRPFEPTDLNEVVSFAMGNLEIAVKEAEATINQSELPTVQGDQGQLIQLFQNLVGNAIKFRGDRPPRIDIAAEPGDGVWTLCVKDNGIGIDAAQVDRIFTIFERLHPMDHYPGSGIGLSVCKRIVERHHGRIWAESEKGAGTAIYFTLPAKRN